MKNTALVYVVLLALLAGCSSKVIPTMPLPPPSLEIEEIDFDYLSAKARMVFTDDKKERDVKAHIRIRKDSVIWMTFTMVGLQGGKALINKDSITIVSTVSKEYFVFDYKELSKRYNFEIDYFTIQSAILGNLIAPRSNTDKISQGSNFNMLEQDRATVSILNYINATTKKLEKVEMKETNTKNSVNINYTNFQPVGNKIYPFNGVVSIFYKNPNGVINNNTITLEYSKAEVGDKELKFPFNIPRKYDRR